MTPDRAAAQRDREAAFARIKSVRGATVIGAGALTAAIAGVVSAVAPGRTLGAKAPVGSAASAASRTTRPRTNALVMPPLANPSQLGLQGPMSPPQSSQPQGTQPQGTQPQGTQPQGTQPAPQPQTQSAPAPQQAPAPVVSGGS